MSYDDLGLDTTPEVSEDELGLDTTPEVSDENSEPLVIISNTKYIFHPVLGNIPSDVYNRWQAGWRPFIPSPKVSLESEILMKLQVKLAASRKAATIAGHEAAEEVNKKVELYSTARADWRRTLERRKRRKV